MRASLLVFFLLYTSFLEAQDNRYFVSFKDKTNTPFSISTPLTFLSQKSLDRRQREHFSTTDADLPVDPAYVQQVRTTGAKTFFTSRWFNGVLVQTDAGTATQISALSCVSKVALVAPGPKLLGGRTLTRNKSEPTYRVESLLDQAQISMIGIDNLQAAGYHGEGIDIAVLDAGFVGVNTIDGFLPLYSEGRVKAVYNFVENSSDVYISDNHGTSTLSILAGKLSNFAGTAYMANYFLYLTEDVMSEYRIEEYNWAFAAERADSAGVDVISSSLGYNQFDDPSMDYTYSNLDGKTTVITRAANMAAARGISVVNSAGNEGGSAWQHIIAPADARGVIAVGAVDGMRVRTGFSSTGPSADGRVKPDVSAMGSGSVFFSTSGCCFSGNGTSFSCPLVAGLVACLHQVFPQASAREIYAMLILNASQSSHPDNLLGYGIPHFSITEVPGRAQTDISLYPNPVTDGELSVRLSDPRSQSLTVDIFNSAGQLVYKTARSLTSTEKEVRLDVSSFASGLYYVRASTPSAVLTQRVVKKN